MNETIVKVKSHLDIAWLELENSIVAAYDDGYSGLVWRLKQIQLQIDNLEVEIDEKEYGDDDEE